jgi:hypothetical protein
MKLTAYSKNRFYKSFDSYHVPKEYADTIYNYLVHGYSPGGFFTSVLANDCLGAITHSHPSNTMQALKYMAVWILNELPRNVCWGSYEVVEAWLKMSAADRRAVLESKRLIFAEEEETVLVLKGEKVEESIGV